MTIYTGTANASLAIIKYWGKIEKGKNIPASTSIGVSLDVLRSKVVITNKKNFSSDRNMNTLQKKGAAPLQLYINGVQYDNTRLKELLQAIQASDAKSFIRYIVPQMKKGMYCNATNTFPTEAGLASSASGGSALVLALAKMFPKMPSKRRLSEWARVYSGSAARSIFGGFCMWEATKPYAKQIAPCDYWNDFRVIVVSVTQLKKKYTSRDAMSITKHTSPYYRTWIKYNNSLVTDLCMAIKHQDIEKLGTIALASYTAMHASAIAAHPSVLFWLPESVAILHLLKEMRTKNIPAWETMDAGPQVKIFTLRPYVVQIIKMIQAVVPSAHTITSRIGGEAH